VVGVTEDTMLVMTEVAPYLDGPAGVHGVLVQASTALAELATMAGLRAQQVSDVSSLPPAQLSGARVLAFFTIGETPFSPAQRQAVEEAWGVGRLRVLGVHSATDACHGWPAYGDLLGGRFDGHPWTQPFQVEVADDGHPSTSHLGATWGWRDEVYLFRDLRPDARVLLRLAPDQLDMSVPGARVPDCGYPLAWCVEDPGGSRSFYTALGHFHSAWETPTYLRHLNGGLSWLLAPDAGK
jgi:uncharacterized protein